MPKCDFNKVAKQFYWNLTSAWVFSCSEHLLLRTPLGGCFWTSLLVFLKIDNPRGLFRTRFCKQIIQTWFWTRLCSSATVASEIMSTSLKSSRIHKDFGPDSLIIFLQSLKMPNRIVKGSDGWLSDYLH